MTNEPSDWAEFRDNGLLWALNRFVLHPRGFALAISYPDGTENPAEGWQIMISEDGIWAYDETTDLDGQRKFHDFIGRLAREHSQRIIDDNNGPDNEQT